MPVCRPMPRIPATETHRPPGGERQLLALDYVVAGGLEGDATAGSAVGRFADQDGAGRGDRLQARGRVHQVAGDHAFVFRAQGHRRFAGQGPGACRQAADAADADGWHRLDQVHGRSNGALGVVLVGDRRAPDRHHRVTDEFLDRAPVAFDDLARDLEVAREELAHVLRIAVLGRGREADQVREQDRHQPSLRLRGRSSQGATHRRAVGRSGRRRWRLLADGGAALATESVRRRVDMAADRAGDGQARTTLTAELAVGLVLVLADDAAHPSEGSPTAARPGSAYHRRACRPPTTPATAIAWPTRPAHTCCSTRTTRSTGTRGAMRRCVARARRPGPSSCPSAMPPAIGAMSWSASRSRTTATAAELNADFVAIKVDREERPDLDAIYMDAVQAMTGAGGWPMSVFLTPDGQPFYGGTYFPDAPRHGMPAFRQVLASVAAAWRDERPQVEAAAARLTAALREQAARTAEAARVAADAAAAATPPAAAVRRG